MTCQHCQTWISDDDHRCPRCGRRVRSTPQRISPATFPVAATATARAYDFSVMPDEAPEARVSSDPELRVGPGSDGQAALFTEPMVDKRVIPFDSLTGPAERESIRARGAELERPAPLKSGKVELQRPRNVKRGASDTQRRLEFSSDADAIRPPVRSIICDAMVAPLALQFRAACWDAAVILAACALMGSAFWYVGGQVPLEKHLLPFYVMALATVPLLYKLIWTFVGRDTPGMRRAGIRLIDFDGNPPSHGRRYYRAFGSILSLLAAGMGLLWALVDEDRLTWQDHISGTFPTVE